MIIHLSLKAKLKAVIIIKKFTENKCLKQQLLKITSYFQSILHRIIIILSYIVSYYLTSYILTKNHYHFPAMLAKLRGADVKFQLI